MWRYLHIPKMSVCEGNHINLRCGYVNVPTYTQDVGSWLVPSAFRKTEIFRGTIFNPSPPILPSLSGEPFNYQSINQSKYYWNRPNKRLSFAWEPPTQLFKKSIFWNKMNMFKHFPKTRKHYFTFHASSKFH